MYPSAVVLTRISSAAAGRRIGLIRERDVNRCLGLAAPLDRAAPARFAPAGITSTDLLTLRPDTPLERAVRLMIKQRIGCLSALASQTLPGTLTKADLHVVLQIFLQTLRRSSLAESTASAASSPQI